MEAAVCTLQAAAFSNPMALDHDCDIYIVNQPILFAAQ